MERLRSEGDQSHPFHAHDKTWRGT